MSFISDVIYGLKIEYGTPVTVVNMTKSDINRESGKQTIVESQLMIPLMIELPISLRQAFLKSVGIHKIGFLESGEQEFLLDSEDILDDFPITEESYLVTETRRLKVKIIEPYDGCIIIIAKAYTQPAIHNMGISDSLSLTDRGTNA